MENPYYDLECIEVDELCENLRDFVTDKVEDNFSFEPIEPSFKIYFYPYGEEYKNNNYLQENISRKNKIARLFIAFIEKDTKALALDGICTELYVEDIKKILIYLESIINV